jgi:hypothetical protein
MIPFIVVCPNDTGEAIEVDSFNVEFLGGNTH